MPDESRIASSAAAGMRAAIRLAGGREVCFVATIDEDGRVNSARPVARGDSSSVLSLPGCARRGEMLVHNHPSGILEPSGADNEVAATLHLDGVGFAIIDNDAARIYVVVEVPHRRPLTLLDETAIARELTGAGRIGKLLPGYEERSSQQALSARIARLYNREGTGVLEAGTGVGKSLAYLLPALRWSAANALRTVVSTNTINLQEQIVSDDLPFLTRALSDQKVSFALLKGWRNYICLQRMANATSQTELLFDESTALGLQELRQWAAVSESGSLSDLPVAPSSEVWDEVAAEPDLCTRQRCEQFERCFVFRARRKAASADVVVVNHHLLMADLMVRRVQQNWLEPAVLPFYDRLIVDEGHHLEDAASQHLGLTASRVGVNRTLSRLDKRANALLAAVGGATTGNAGLIAIETSRLVVERLTPSAQAARRLATRLFDILEVHLRNHGTPTLRLTAEFAESDIWRGELRSVLTDLLAEMSLLADILETIRRRLSAIDTGEEDPPVLAELKSISRRLLAAGDAIQAALMPAGNPLETVRWMERRGRDNNVALAAVPLDLSKILREDLFARMKTAVVTSATLSTNGSFAFVSGRLGLNTAELKPATGIFPSPFHFGDQTLLAIPSDFPVPSEAPEEHIEAVIQGVLHLAECSDGGIFVLCTSHRDIRRIADGLRARRGAASWPLLVHGEGEPRAGMLRRFRDSGRAILLGTSSFWEGVDVRGHALRGIFIVRLPFKVPTEPLTAAHCEAIASEGGDPFAQYLLPHASLRLKQGFGRLIRSTTDWGAVVIADPRIVMRSYGTALLDSLPSARRATGTWLEVADELRRFYAANK